MYDMIILEKDFKWVQFHSQPIQINIISFKII